jgi:hypothetical protein
LPTYTTPRFWFNALWLAAWYYAKPLFLMGNIVFDLRFCIYAHFVKNAIRAQNKGWV